MQLNVETSNSDFVTGADILLPGEGRQQAAGTAPAAALVHPRPSAGTTPSAAFLRQIEDEIPFLKRAVRRWHRDKADADDLVQDTLVQALANAHLWQPGSDLRAWLFTIMRNRFLGTVAKSHR